LAEIDSAVTIAFVGESNSSVLWQIQKTEVTKMELMVLLECLKLLWLGFEIVKHLISRKREKAMIEALEKLNHRLIQLESKTKEIP